MFSVPQLREYSMFAVLVQEYNLINDIGLAKIIVPSYYLYSEREFRGSVPTAES